MAFIEADPYPWPFDGHLRPSDTTLIVIDMQTDFCGKGGYVDSMGYDLSLTRAPIEPISRVLDAMRSKVIGSFTPAKDTAAIFPTYQRTSGGGHSVLGPGSATPDRAERSLSAASLAGISSRNSPRATAKQLLTNQEKAPFAQRTLS
jgi:hypothetical protein